MSSPDSLFIQGVLSHALDTVWKQVVPLLEQALEYADTKYCIDDIYQLLTVGEMQLWLAFKQSTLCAFCITRIMNYPRDKRAAILFASGHDVLQWVMLNETIKDWATTKGCSALEVWGRPGWEKLLAPYGYEKIHTVLKVNLPKVH